MTLKKLVIAIAGVLITLPTSTQTLDIERDNVQAFINVMVNEHQLARGDVEAVLKQAETKESILEAMRRPAEKSKPWHAYRKIFLTSRRIREGVAFWKTHRDAIESVADARGVPPEIIVAIIGVETHYGRITGSYRVVDALSTLAFDYPPRSPFFTKELEHFFLLSSEEPVELLNAKGSYAGAMGAPQFIPSSYRRYAADGDDDGRRNLFTSWHDVFASIANYFVEHGWQTGGPIVSRADGDPRLAERLELRRLATVYRTEFLQQEGLQFERLSGADDRAMVINFEGETEPEIWIGYQNFYVITRYNRSKMYAMAVHQLSEAIRDGMLVDE
ncbi:MAG: lytic murein transglycosylase B [Pseudomonadota bacterium]